MLFLPSQKKVITTCMCSCDNKVQVHNAALAVCDEFQLVDGEIDVAGFPDVPI